MGLVAKMICVDDDSFILQMIETYMEGHFQVVLARSAEEGLGIMELQGPFDIVISDHDMPGMKGLDFLRLVAERWPETIRVLMSGGNADMAQVELAIRAGQIYLFLAKPFCMLSLRIRLMDDCNRGGTK
jgi:DNA-binding NtrC family response regulator